MAKLVIKIPHVAWRDGRPRFGGSKASRALGFPGEDLRHNNGVWFTVEEAIAWSRARETQMAEKRAALASGKRLAKARSYAAGAITVAGLFAEWFKTPRMNGRRVVEGKKEREPLKATTVQFYKDAAKTVERFDPLPGSGPGQPQGRVWASPAAAVSGKAWAGILDRIEVERGLATARAMRAVVSAAYSFGVGAGKVPTHPLLGLRLDIPVPAPRIRYGAIAEMQHLVKAADLIGRPDVGDAIVLGLWTGQRQNDRLALEDGRDTPDGIVFRQSKKHGQPLLVPKAPELALRLSAARARRHDWRVNYPNVILDEAARAPFKKRWYGEQFSRVREAAVRGVLAPRSGETANRLGDPGLTAASQGPWLLKPMPSLAGFRDQDLRDTAVTWLALAGASKFEIVSITGHSLKSIDQILSHYLGMHPELARSAIAKLVVWHEGQGPSTRAQDEGEG